MQYIVVENVYVKDEGGKVFQIASFDIDGDHGVTILSGLKTFDECSSWVEMLERAETESRRMSLLFSLART